MGRLTPVKGSRPVASLGPATREDQSRSPPPFAREVTRSVVEGQYYQYRSKTYFRALNSKRNLRACA